MAKWARARCANGRARPAHNRFIVFERSRGARRGAKRDAMCAAVARRGEHGHPGPARPIYAMRGATERTRCSRGARAGAIAGAGARSARATGAESRELAVILGHAPLGQVAPTTPNHPVSEVCGFFVFCECGSLWVDEGSIAGRCGSLSQALQKRKTATERTLYQWTAAFFLEVGTRLLLRIDQLASSPTRRSGSQSLVPTDHHPAVFSSI